MKFDPAGVERTARAIKAAYLEGHTPLDAATAALTAYFDHLRDVGKMQECRVWDHSGSDYWSANTSNTPMKVNDFMGVIIKVEEPNAKA